jgi:hypothetical protein
MNNKKQILISYIVIALLVSVVAFDKLFYSHKEESLLAKKMASLVSESFGTVWYSNPFSIPTIKMTTTVATGTATSTTKATATTTATSTATTTIKKILPPESPTDYKDNGDGTITDNYTKLMWAKCTQGNTGKDCKGGSPSQREWSKARNECDALTLAKKTGWRLPTLKELQSIVDSGAFTPSINKTFFLNTASSPYWTSTAPAQYLSSKFTVLFSDGSVYFKDGGNFAATRCVRDNI